MMYKLLANWKEQVGTLESIKLELLEIDQPYSLEEIKQITQTRLTIEALEVVLKNHLKKVFLELKMIPKQTKTEVKNVEIPQKEQEVQNDDTQQETETEVKNVKNKKNIK